MKRKFFAFILLISAGLSLSSCLSSDDDTNIEYSHDTAVTAFSLGTMGQYVKRLTGSTAGAYDSLATSAVTGSDYKFTIDQTKHEIYNEDSLPIRTRTAAALATISAKNSNYIQLIYNKTDVKEGDSKDSIVWYNSSDSINFDKLNADKAIRVYAQDFTVYADYKLTVNVHKERADSFVWHSMAPIAAGLSDMKAVALKDGAVCVLGKSSADNTVAYTFKNNSWSPAFANHTLTAAACQSVASLGGTLYLIDNGKVLASTDGINLTEVSANAGVTQLLGAGSKYLYARAAQGISASEDGKTWFSQVLDEVVDSLPTQSISLNAVSIASTKNAENLFLLGTHASEHGDTIAVAWTHTADYNQSSPSGQKWNYIDYDKNEPGKLPYLSQIVASTSSDGLVALGSNKKWYKSINGGLTWKVDTTMTLPENFDASKPFALTRVRTEEVTSQGTKYYSYFYWLINGRNVWKGRFNKDGWVRKD